MLLRWSGVGSEGTIGSESLADWRITMLGKFFPADWGTGDVIETNHYRPWWWSVVLADH